MDVSSVRRGVTSSGVDGLLERAGLTWTGVGTVVIMVVGWIVARVIGAKSMYLIVYAAALAMIMAFLIARRRLQIDVSRSRLSPRMRVGQNIDVQLTMIGRRRASTIVMRELLHPRLGATVVIPVDTLGSGESMDHTYSFRPSLRGAYDVGPLTATWNDPFGMTAHRQELAPPTRVIVHPATEPVQDRVLTRMWEDPPVRPPVSKPWPVGFEFYGMRDYVQGDDLRRVVWATVAKTGRMMVRESEQGITDRVVIVVDTDREHHTGGEVSESFELAVKTAASIGVQHLKDGFAVTLVTNDGRPCVSLRGARAELRLLDVLAQLQLSETRFAALGPTLMSEARSRAHFLVITPHLDGDGATRMRLLVERGISVVIARIVHDESDPMSSSRAAAVGAQVVQITPGVPLSAVFSHLIGRGRRQ